MGLHGEMQLQLVSGPTRVADLSGRSEQGQALDELAFVWTGSRLFVAEVYDVRPIGVEQLFEVELDDGSVVKVSSSSKFVVKSGESKLPPELKPGDSLLPLYLGQDVHGYPTYKVPGKSVRRKISRLIAEWKVGRPLGKGTVVSHIDGDRKNYQPDNLKVSLHERKEKRPRKHKLVKVYKAAQDLLDECATASPTMEEIVRKHRRTNHKVVRVTPGVLGEVYTASVRSESFVAVSGVFLELPS